MPIIPGVFKSLFAQITGSLALRRAVLVAAALIGVLLIGDFIHPKDTRDMSLYWEAGRAAWVRGPLYHHYDSFGPDQMPGYYFYSPPFALAVSPLAQLPYVWFARVWYLLLLAAYAVYVWCLVKLAYGETRPNLLVLVAAIMLFPPLDAFGTLREGQADILIWAALAVALVSGRRGALLTAALFIKPHLIWALLTTLRREFRLAVIPSVLVGVAGIALGLCCYGAAVYRDWLTAIAPLSQGTFYWLNISPSILVLRVLRWTGLWQYAGGPLTLGPRLWLGLVAAGGPVAAYTLTRRCSTQLQVACVAAASVICSPLCWLYYLGVSMAPLAVWWGERRVAACPPGTEGENG